MINYTPDKPFTFLHKILLIVGVSSIPLLLFSSIQNSLMEDPEKLTIENYTHSIWLHNNPHGTFKEFKQSYQDKITGLKLGINLTEYVFMILIGVPVAYVLFKDNFKKNNEVKK